MRVDIRQTSRRLAVRNGDQVIADTTRPIALYQSGFAPRWYVPRVDIDESTLAPNETQTFCPYKGVCSYYDMAMPIERHGPTVSPTPKSRVCQISFPLSRTRSRWSSTIGNSTSSPAKPSSRTASTAT